MTGCRAAEIQNILAAAFLLGLLPEGPVVAASRVPEASIEAGMRVELDIFSGRPNPSWHLTEAEGAEMHTAIRSLPVTHARSLIAPGLGYRGLKVRDEGQPMWSVSVFNGAVEVHGSGQVEIRRDEGRRFERWLLGTAGAELDEGVRSRVPLE